jgi:hypothetical protein
MNIMCKVGLHKWGTTVTRPTRDSSIVWNRNTCQRSDCCHEKIYWTITPDWCREDICDSVYCGSDSEHRVHMPDQFDRIRAQRETK